MYNTKAFKGEYNGIPYDSELEATWYRLLDKLGINYTVPKTSQGFRGLIPDLLIGEKIIAEIKPLDFRKPKEYDYWIQNLINKFNRYREIPEQAKKTQLILGNGLNIFDHAFLDYTFIGYLRYPNSDIFNAAFVSVSGEFLTLPGEITEEVSSSIVDVKTLLRLWHQSEFEAKSNRRLKEAFAHFLQDSA